ncbi:MAG: prepilin-type N-terminal cleavage/methylation domain-containing protein [Magnetococcales bacterium]|nr:prepilin-type N-terminal cleavage/methylation domain-containing protein [Magnetococcales bacterium]
MRDRYATHGFTLLELLITAAIVAILAAVALPNYQESIVKSRRADVQQLMVGIANREEIYLMDALSYTDSFTTLNFSGDTASATSGWVCSGASCANGYYTVTVAAPGGAPPSFTITAIPVAGSSQANDGTMTLTNAGVKTRTGVASGW